MKSKKALLVVSATILTVGLIAGNAAGAQLSIGEFITSGTTIIVAPKETPTASGAVLLAAIDAIVDASESKSYLVSIMPGVYDLGEKALEMKSYVSVQGAGVTETKIKGSMEGTETWVVIIEEKVNVHLSQLSVESTGKGDYNTAILVIDSSPYIHNVWALASGGGQNMGIINNEASPTLDEMHCIASGQAQSNVGVFNTSSSPIMRNVYAEGSGATYNFGVMNQGGNPLLRYMTVVAKGGDTAVGVLNEQASAPQLVHVGVTALDAATDNAGIRNFSSSNATIADLFITVKGGQRTKGIHTVESSVAHVKNVSISVSGGTERNYGVFVDSADAFLERMLINVQGKGGPEAIGVGVQNASTVRVNHSTISAATHSVQAGGTGADLDLGCTVLYGGPAVGASFTPCN